jgi:hypothetical protein
MARSKLKDHERLLRQRLYELYRDMPSRSYERLIVVAEKTHGLLTKRQIAVIARDDRWKERIDEHEAATSKPAGIVLDPNFDRTDRLLRAAHLALERAIMDQTRKPQEMKALVDTAEKAIRLVEKLRELGVSQRGPQAASESLKRLRRIMDAMDDAVRAKFAAQGTPVKDHVTDAEFVEVKPDIEPDIADQKALPAPSEEPLQTATNLHGELIAEADKVLTVAERLQQMGRKS